MADWDPGHSDRKARAISDFAAHVSSRKVDFFLRNGMDFVMGRREGNYLWDIDGRKRLLDLHCNGGVFNLGHRSPELIGILKSALEELDIGNHHLLSLERAETAALLASLMPEDLEYVVFGASGGEAVDLSIKVARGFTGRRKIISARGAYHGHTGLALAAGNEKYRKPFGFQLPGFVQVRFDDIETLEKHLDGSVAAVILETVPATLGMVVPSPEYLPTVRELCTQSGALLILDEVQAGMGRTGRLWAFEHFNIVPDMVVLGKGLSGGLYPMAATVLRKPLESVFHPDPFIHVSTFGGAEVGCRVARRVLEISSSPEFLKHVNALAARFAKDIEALRRKYPRFLNGFRHSGLMMGLKLQGKYSGPALTKSAFDHDLLMIYANNDPSVCQFLPPLTLDINDVDGIMEQLDKALHEARKLRPARKLLRKIEVLRGEKA